MHISFYCLESFLVVQKMYNKGTITTSTPPKQLETRLALCFFCMKSNGFKLWFQEWSLQTREPPPQSTHIRKGLPRFILSSPRSLGLECLLGVPSQNVCTERVSRTKLWKTWLWNSSCYNLLLVCLFETTRSKSNRPRPNYSPPQSSLRSQTTTVPSLSAGFRKTLHQHTFTKEFKIH